MSLPILYIKQGCPWCIDALAYFKNKNMQLQVIDVNKEAGMMQELIQVSGQPKTPTLKNGDFVVADFDISEFEQALQDNPEEAKKLGL
jgi:glutaredoxin 3